MAEQFQPRQESTLHLRTNSLRYRSPACCASRKDLRCTVPDICEPSLKQSRVQHAGRHGKAGGFESRSIQVGGYEYYTVTCA